MHETKEVKKLNRIKLVLVEKGLTGRWLAQELGKDPVTVSKWCTNTSQPTLENLYNIAKTLEVPVDALLNKEL